MLKMLRSEVHKGRDALARCRRETEEKSADLEKVGAALSEPAVTKSDIDSLEGEIASMRAEKEALEQKIDEHNQDSRLSVYKQQANLVAKKKEVVLKEKKQLEEEREALCHSLSAKERE